MIDDIKNEHEGVAKQIKVNPHSQYLRKLEFDNRTNEEKVEGEKKTNIKINIELETEDLEEDISSIIFKLVIKPEGGEGGFDIKIEYVGKFEITGGDESIKDQILRINCATVIYPYICRVVSDITDEGNMNKVKLMPIDFNGMYQANKRKMN